MVEASPGVLRELGHFPPKEAKLFGSQGGHVVKTRHHWRSGSLFIVYIYVFPFLSESNMMFLIFFDVDDSDNDSCFKCANMVYCVDSSISSGSCFMSVVFFFASLGRHCSRWKGKSKRK